MIAGINPKPEVNNPAQFVPPLRERQSCPWHRIDPGKKNQYTVIDMMTAWYRNAIRITGPLRGETTGYRRIPITQRTSHAELLMFLFLVPEQVETNSRIAGNQGISHDKTIFGVSSPMHYFAYDLLWSIHISSANATELLCQPPLIN